MSYDRVKDFPLHPNAMTCTDCQFFLRFCKPIIGLKGSETTCDYAPTRFAEYPEWAKPKRAEAQS